MSFSPASGEVDRVEVALRVTGDGLDPDRISRMLGVSPTFAARKGQIVERDGRRGQQSTGIWMLALPISLEWELGDAIRTLLEQFPPDPALWESLALEFRTDVVCGLFLEARNRGAALTIETMALLVERRLELVLDIHGEESS